MVGLPKIYPCAKRAPPPLPPGAVDVTGGYVGEQGDSPEQASTD